MTSLVHIVLLASISFAEACAFPSRWLPCWPPLRQYSSFPELSLSPVLPYTRQIRLSSPLSAVADFNHLCPCRKNSSYPHIRNSHRNHGNCNARHDERIFHFPASLLLSLLFKYSPLYLQTPQAASLLPPAAPF